MDGNRYFLTEGDNPEREVKKEEWVNAERRAGFYNPRDRSSMEPATAGFGVTKWGSEAIRGRIEPMSHF